MRYRAEYDGDRQWVLYKMVDSRVKGGDGKLTEETREKEVVVGFFPKLSQAASRMYECMVADGIQQFSQGELGLVIAECRRCAALVTQHVDNIFSSKKQEVIHGE